MGIGTSNFVRLLDIDLVIMSGPLIRNNPDYINFVKEHVNKYIHKEIHFIDTGNFGDANIALGSIAIVIEKLLRNNY